MREAIELLVGDMVLERFAVLGAEKEEEEETEEEEEEFMAPGPLELRSG